MAHFTSRTTAGSGAGGRLTIEVGYQDTDSTDSLVRARRWTLDAMGHRWWPYVVDVSGLPVVGVQEVADAVCDADNNPSPPSSVTLAGRIRQAMDEIYATTSERHHSLSPGDRVRVGETEVVCAPVGWIPAGSLTSSPPAAVLPGVGPGLG